MRQAWLMLVGVVLACGLAACGPEKPAGGTGPSAKPASKPAAKTVIGVSFLTRTHPFYQEMEAAMKAEAEKRGFELLIDTGEFDVAKQKDQLANYIVKKVSAIIVCPCDSKSIGTSITEANKAGIPVFTADIACLAEGPKVVCHVASDNLGGGRLAEQALAEALGGTGKIAIIDHPEVESVILRTKGFEEELPKHPNLKLVAKLPGKGQKDQAFKAAEDLLQANPDLNGIFGINDDSVLGALAAVEKAGKQGKVVLVGFDAVPEARKVIGEGKVYADVIQQPGVIGQKTVDAIARYMAGEKVEAQILIPCSLFKKADAEKAGK